jgi:hypothetical protein
MTEAAVAADVHQTLDVHGRLATQVAFDRELGDLVADFFEIAVGQVFDLLRVGDAACFANLASAGATDTENSGQANLSVFPETLCSALALLVSRIGTDHANNALAADDLAVTADFLNGSRNSHLLFS